MNALYQIIRKVQIQYPEVKQRG